MKNQTWLKDLEVQTRSRTRHNKSIQTNSMYQAFGCHLNTICNCFFIALSKTGTFTVHCMFWQKKHIRLCMLIFLIFHLKLGDIHGRTTKSLSAISIKCSSCHALNVLAGKKTLDCACLYLWDIISIRVKSRYHTATAFFNAVFYKSSVCKTKTWIV